MFGSCEVGPEQMHRGLAKKLTQLIRNLMSSERWKVAFRDSIQCRQPIRVEQQSLRFFHPLRHHWIAAESLLAE